MLGLLASAIADNRRGEYRETYLCNDADAVEKTVPSDVTNVVLSDRGHQNLVLD